MLKMNESKKSTKIVNGKKIKTQTMEFQSANTIEVEVGTNGFKGGDTGHGSRTYFRLKNLTSTDIEFKIKENDSLEILLGGDAELFTFINALEFALDVLKNNR